MLKTLHMLVPYTRVDVILRFAAASVWNATRGLVCRESTNVEMRIWSLIKKHAAECYDMVRVRYGFWWYGLGTGYDKQNPYHKTRCTHRILPWRTKRSYHSFERIIEYVTCPLDKALKLRGRICSSSQCCCSAAHGSPAMNPFCSVSVLFEQHLCGHASRPVPCDHGIFRMSFKFCLPSHTFSASFPHCLCSSILLGSTGADLSSETIQPGYVQVPISRISYLLVPWIEYMPATSLIFLWSALTSEFQIVCPPLRRPGGR